MMKLNRFFQQTSRLYSFFCYQCEQTDGGVGCQNQSSCGKDENTAVLIDLLTENIKELSYAANHILEKGCACESDLVSEIQQFTVDSNYATLTNVNFDSARYVEYLEQCSEYYDLMESCEKFDLELNRPLPEVMELKELVDKGREYAIPDRIETLGEDIVSLQELITYGLRGYAAYLHEADYLTDVDSSLYDAYTKAYSFLSSHNEKENTVVDNLVACALEVGENNVGVMAALDQGNNELFGMPSPGEILISPKEGKCILVSGHNIQTLVEILEQTKDTGINVYTHGEMLPAHNYPEVKKYDHLVGHYGTAWQNQQKEFKKFPGAILLTTNCLLAPKKKYRHRVFSHSIVGHEDVKHIEGNDFQVVIDAALREKGFKKDDAEKTILSGFGHGFVLSIADVIIEAVKNGDIEHFWLVGGCDGARGQRNYFTDLTQELPDNHVILTLGCGKFKFNYLDHGVIETQGTEIPRLLDVGQCNDAYGAVVIASALRDAFGLDHINDLPLSLVISWFEQKAVGNATDDIQKILEEKGK